MGLHRCTECGNSWSCMDMDCDAEGEDYTCRVCTGKKWDCNPDTRISYSGAFNEWVKQYV